jgi:hypothetical protein
MSRRREKERECDGANIIKVYCIYVWKQHDKTHWNLLKSGSREKRDLQESNERGKFGQSKLYAYMKISQ